MKPYYRDTLPVYYFKEALKKEQISKTSPSLKNDDFRVEIIQTKDDFFQLKTTWNELVSSSQDPNPFILWEWAYTWWEVYSSKADTLYIIALYDGNELISIAPFYIKKQLGFIYRLSVLGEGEKNIDAAITHYPDIIIRKTHQKEAVICLAKVLDSGVESKTYSFDYASFDLLKENAALHQLTKQLSSRLTIQLQQEANQFSLLLPNNFDGYLSGLSKSSRKQFRLKQNRMNKLGEIQITSEKCLKEGLDITEKLHRARWKNISNDCVFDSEKFTLFHQKLCENFADQNVIDFRILRINNTPVVAAYNFNYNKTCFSYLSGFESEDDKRLSPMFIFDILEIKNLIKKKYNYLDLLVSESEHSYKTKFGSDVIPVYKMRWFRKNPVSYLLKNIFIIKSFLSLLYIA